jgi:hypothetical protein
VEIAAQGIEDAVELDRESSARKEQRGYCCVKVAKVSGVKWNENESTDRPPQEHNTQQTTDTQTTASRAPNKGRSATKVNNKKSTPEAPANKTTTVVTSWMFCSFVSLEPKQCQHSQRSC